MSLPPISDEQQEVVKAIGKSTNVIVESVAGSGKTTCNIYIAKSCESINRRRSINNHTS